jgi:hypothetical protein
LLRDQIYTIPFPSEGTNPNKLPKGTQNFEKCRTLKAQSDGKKKKKKRRRRRRRRD